jgi:hypothetical protein
MSKLEIEDGDVKYLEAIEHEPFYPGGQLYTSVLEGLVERGLAKHFGFGGYKISDGGAKALAEHRAATGKKS